VSQLDVPQIAYLLAGLLVMGSAVFWASRRAKAVGAKGPGIFLSLLIWGGLLAAVTLLYQGVAIWTWTLSLFSAG
jgi:hypothetical protein